MLHKPADFRPRMTCHSSFHVRNSVSIVHSYVFASVTISVTLSSRNFLTCNSGSRTANMAQPQPSELALSKQRQAQPVEHSRGDGQGVSGPAQQASGVSGRCSFHPVPLNGSYWPWSKWFKVLLIRIGIIVLVYGIILGLQQYEIWEPCQYKISYHRECKVDTYIYEVLSYTTYQEDFFCVVPGITFHQTETGWNMDRKCT